MNSNETTRRPGVIVEPAFVMLPDPVAVFERRAERLRFLASASRLGPYLTFLAAIVSCQAAVSKELRAPPAGAVRPRALQSGMPPINRGDLSRSPELWTVLDRLLELAAGVDMPEAALSTRLALASADEETRVRVIEQVLDADVAGEDAGPALYAAAAVQVHASRLASTLEADALAPVSVGVCPCCGGRPATSVVVSDKRAEGARYAACATCCTLWNEVRIKCLACGSTKGIGYRSLGDDAVTKAEVCDQCHSWIKILYATRDTAMEPIADDVASLGLDTLMRDSDWQRAAFNPFIIGF